MKQKLILTLKTWPVVVAAAVAICFLTGFVSKAFFGIELQEQASIEIVRETVSALVRRICFSDGLKWTLFRDVWSLAKILLVLIVIVPAAEEVLFRWFLYSLPKPSLHIVSAVASSALFSAAHYIQMPWPNDAFIALFFFGMAQCWLYRKTGALWCPILNHGLFNATNLALIFIVPS